MSTHYGPKRENAHIMVYQMPARDFPTPGSSVQTAGQTRIWVSHSPSFENSVNVIAKLPFTK